MLQRSNSLLQCKTLSQVGSAARAEVLVQIIILFVSNTLNYNKIVKQTNSRRRQRRSRVVFMLDATLWQKNREEEIVGRKSATGVSR